MEIKPFTLVAFLLLAAFAAAKVLLKGAPNKVIAAFDMGMGVFSLVLMLALKEKLPSYYFPLYIRGCGKLLNNTSYLIISNILSNYFLKPWEPFGSFGKCESEFFCR